MFGDERGNVCITEGKVSMKEFINIECLEFVAECRETKEQVVFTMGDLYGWDDETVFLDTGIYLNKPRKVNWAIVCKGSLGRRLNPAYNIHIRTDEDKLLKEPLKLLSIKNTPNTVLKRNLIIMSSVREVFCGENSNWKNCGKNFLIMRRNLGRLLMRRRLNVQG